MVQKTTHLGFNYLVKLLVRYSPLIIIQIFFFAIDSITYTYVPLFTQYLFSLLDTMDVTMVKSQFPQWLIDFIGSYGPDIMSVVIVLALTLAGYQLLRAIYKVVTGIYSNYIGNNISRNLRNDLYAHIQDLPYQYHKNADIGDLIQRCTSDIDSVQNFLCQLLPEAFSVFAIVISAVVKIARISGGQLTYVSLIIIPVAFFSSFFFCRYIQKKYDEIEKDEAKLMTIIQENIANVRVVKAFANEKFELDRFEKQNAAYAHKNVNMQKKSALYWGLSDFTSMAQLAVTMMVAIKLANDPSSDLTISDIVPIISLVGVYIWPIRSLGRIIAEIGKATVSAGRIREILINKSEYDTDGDLTPLITGAIEFKDVYFKFDDSETNLLNGVSFRVNPGETIAIVGKTGSGKSTIAKLLTRLNDYQSGEILIDGIDLKRIKRQHARQNIGLILQDPFLFSRTVSENIAITNKNIEFDRIKKAAEIAAVDQDISSFEKGYQTIVGEKGTTLSGGQKQRVAIARILINERPILIFDDSLSALDTQTDLMIRQALSQYEPKSTLFIITHRITTAKQADKIIVLEDGVITQCGTHQELAATPGLYQKLWEIQKELEAQFLKVLNGEVS